MNSICRAAYLVAFTVACGGTGGGGGPIEPPPPRLTPPASAGHALVYADGLERILLVNAGLGGATSSPASTPTRIWSWNGSEWSVLDSAGPPIRNLGGVAYDSRRAMLVLHGGTYDASHSYGDTWEWSPATGWRQSVGAGPGMIDHTQMAYDAERGKVVLFGGELRPQGAPSGDTWEFDGNAWTRAATTGPAARVHHAMQFDPVLKRIVVFGGFTPGGTDLGDTWAWDGAAWTSLGAPVSPRTHASMAFHRRLGGLVLVGGSMQSGGLAATMHVSAGWVPLNVASEPSRRYLTAVAYDVRRDVYVLFGGGNPNGSNLYADTWEFDGTSWREVNR